MRNQALRADFLMLITAMIWGSAFVAQRVGMDNIGPLLFTGMLAAQLWPRKASPVTTDTEIPQTARH